MDLNPYQSKNYHKLTMKTWATLQPNTPFNHLFPDGKVPLKSIFPIIPREQGSPACYLLDADFLSDEQIEALSEAIYQNWQPECESVQMAVDYIREGLPLRCEYFSGVTTTDQSVVALILD